MKHKKFTLTVLVNVCDGMQGKVLEEIRQWRLYSEKTFDHGTDVKVYVNHEEVSETNND